MKNPKLSSRSQEHYTPASVTERTRELLGGIDLDPASCELANKNVRATTIFQAASNGLAQEWHGNVFLNPPGGKESNNRSNAKTWWFKLAREWLEGRVRAAIYIGFSIEFLQTSQRDAPNGLPLPFDFPFMIPRERLAFLHEVDGTLTVGKSPTHANVIVYLPPRLAVADHSAFERVFGNLGRVVLPRWRPVPLRPLPPLSPDASASNGRALVPRLSPPLFGYPPLNLPPPPPDPTSPSEQPATGSGCDQSDVESASTTLNQERSS